jgi:DNA-binding CsgD family transcriptional regulator
VKKTPLIRGSSASTAQGNPAVTFRAHSAVGHFETIPRGILASRSQPPPVADRSNLRQILSADNAPQESCRELYFFLERTTGASHFRVEAGPDGVFPVEQAAGLLAMHCMARGQSPGDYIIVKQAPQKLFEGLIGKAASLLRLGHSVDTSVKVTRREGEVLGGIMRTLANKEIADSLHLSERTVKFHVSSLLAKYGVRGRMALAREVMLRISGATEEQSSAIPVRDGR